MSIPTQPHPAFGHDAPPQADSTPTRHLCAAAYLDEGFRQVSLREAYYQARRVVAPSYGFRLVPVLWHCLRARRAATARDSVIVVLLIFSICCFFLPFASVIMSLIALNVAVTLWRIGRDVVSRVRTGDAVPLRTMLVRGIQVVGGLLVLSAAWVILWFVLFAVAASAAFTGPTPSDDDGGAGGFAALSWLSFFVTLAIIALPAAMNLWGQAQLKQFVPGGWAGDPPRTERFDDIHRQEQGNTTVYSGYHPFVGSGEAIDSWGFAQRLVRASDALGSPRGELEREFEVAPFTALEIIAHVRQHLQALAGDPDPERNLPGLAVEDRVFLAGTEVSHLSPVTDPDRVAQIIRFPTTPARHYLACRVISWRGELVTSVYVHFAVQGRSLYLEITTTALPPCDERYRIVDQVDGTGALAYWRALGKGIADTPRTVAVAPINVARAIVDAAASQSAAPAQVALGYDYGARFSVRELGAAAVTRNHVQTQDILKHKRIIERRVVAAVLDFLEARGVDTSEYRQRAVTILNAGAVNTGSGSMYVETATGQQNQAPLSRRAGN
jgi:hypothetical protein